ncbi:MCE family protein [Pseudomonas sp. v388]|uniref:PqiB family protein n=1 Tax=Pseudomonas sp. v388 TaxID=2479849 RepID=UPI000F7AC925|nr:MlaD family protein [Pseudomonas sp. v388]RRV07547.1 MCE family protein [Pseudomonas sp. v388]
MADTDPSVPTIRPASSWSLIWVLPILALLIGGWLLWRAYDQAGVEIEVIFATGEGLQAGKTEVIFKGMPIGKLQHLTLDESGERRGVIATLEMDKRVEPYLRERTRFWLVKPSVTLAGVSGLETLMSGNYIAASPGDGEPARKYIALAEPPPLADTLPGLHLTLRAERLGSVSRDSLVFYKQIPVGRVKSHSLAADQNSVDIKILIDPEYASLVRRNTRFWNASGVTVDASLSGVKVRTESLASIVTGGIAFASKDQQHDPPLGDPVQPFTLYDDFDAAQVGVTINVRFPDFEGLQAGHTPVMYKGIQVGTLKTLVGVDDLTSAAAQLTLDPRAEPYMVEGTEFWLVKPSISLAGISGLEALVKGNYIAVRPGKKGAPPARDFVARAKPPPLDPRAPGLHLVLYAGALGSLEVGSPVLYKQIKVGSVQSYQLSRDRSQVAFGVHIEPDYATLVNSSTRFWNASGVTLTGGLSGIKLKSESLQSLLAGGISFETPDPTARTSARKVQRFNLFADRESAMKPGMLIDIHLPDGEGLRPGAPIRYKGLDIGSVEKMELTANSAGVVLKARITEGAERVARAGTQFWVVKPQLGLTRAANLETVLTGRYVQVMPAPRPGAVQTTFNVLPAPPALDEPEPGLNLILSAARRRSIKPGVAVTYREIPVGKVTRVELGSTADRVLIHIVIEPRYAVLVRTGSRFWHASGFGFDWGLTKGASIRTESVESLLEGGIAFATPDTPQMGKPAQPRQIFALMDEAEDEWLGWAPRIQLAP